MIELDPLILLRALEYSKMKVMTVKQTTIKSNTFQLFSKYCLE